MGHLSLNGLSIYGKVAVLFGRNAGFQGSTLSGHHMTTSFGSSELLTCGLLQRGQDHSPPKACFYLRNPALVGSHSAMNIQYLNTMGVGLNRQPYNQLPELHSSCHKCCMVMVVTRILVANKSKALSL